MRTDVLQRLKAMGATDAKIASLRAHFDDDTIAQLLGQIEQAHEAAAEQRIAYKETPTMAQPPIYDREAEQADQIAAIIERAAQHNEDRIWHHYEQGRFEIALKAAELFEEASRKGTLSEFPARMHDAIIAALSAHNEQTVTKAVVGALNTLQTMPTSGGQKVYRPADDPYATAAGADQLDQAGRVAGIDMRPR